MVLGPDAISAHQFSSSLRGFDKNEVRGFLKRVAHDVASLQAELDQLREQQQELERATEAAASESDASQAPDASQEPEAEQQAEAKEAPAETPAAPAGLLSTPVVTQPGPGAIVPAPVPGALAGRPTPAADDQFEALGERIAELLRSAYDSASRLKEAAEAEAVVIRREAEAEAARIRQVAEQERSSAVELAAAQLDAREQSVGALESAAQHDRDEAMTELADAREQVAVLLEQARNQSDFIRHEAEEIIRGRVRANVEQAEQRLNVLRNTEIASRERIAAVYRELETALARLDDESAPALPDNPEQMVLEEARGRLDEANGTTPTAGTNGDTEVEATSTVEHGLDEREIVEAEVIDDAPGVDEPSSEQAGAGEAEPAREVGHDDAVRPEDDSESDRADAFADDELEDDDDHEDDDEDDDEDESEDALARMVREAMQRAVESARNIED